jgi:hypothetical protein
VEGDDVGARIEVAQIFGRVVGVPGIAAEAQYDRGIPTRSEPSSAARWRRSAPGGKGPAPPAAPTGNSARPWNAKARTQIRR